jgi:F-type H+-transporting ATPase subunit a
MDEETTLLDLLPGVHNLKAFLHVYLGRDHFPPQYQMLDKFPTHFTITHVLSATLVTLFIIIGALAFKRGVGKGGESAIVPPRDFSLRLLFEMFTDAVYSVAEGVMGEKNAKRYLPIIGTCAVFIFFSNVLALIPGFAPPTAILKTTIVLAVFVFLMTHIFGVKENGLAYFKHFMGPVIWLAPLFVIIEVVSHFARILSLSIRLCGNMAADHKVVGAFFALVPLLVPVPFLILGVLVAIVQTLVFCLLTMVYIQSAVDHGHGDEHGDHGHDDHHHYDPKAEDATA